MKIADLKPADYNPRTSTKQQEENLKASLEKFGVVEPVIFNKQSGHIVGGHFRVRELKKLGHKEIDCVIVDLNEEDEKELNIRLNANTGDFDWERLANEWNAEQLLDWGLKIPNFEPAELEAEEDDFDVPEIETCTPIPPLPPPAPVEPVESLTPELAPFVPTAPAPPPPPLEASAPPAAP